MQLVQDSHTHLSSYPVSKDSVSFYFVFQKINVFNLIVIELLYILTQCLSQYLVLMTWTQLKFNLVLITESQNGRCWKKPLKTL